MSGREGAGSTLTAAQRALFESVRDLPAEVARIALRPGGPARLRELSFEEVESIATIAVMEATATFDPTLGKPFRSWAYFAASNRLLDICRAERSRHAKAEAMFRAAVITHLATDSAEVEIGRDTEITLADKLHGMTNPTLVIALQEVAVAEPTCGGEDEIAEVEAAGKAGAALREILPPAGSDERRVLDLHFRQRMSLTEIAAVMGVGEGGYRTFVRRFHRALEGIREELARRGIEEMPPWREDVSGHPLGEGEGAPPSVA